MPALGCSTCYGRRSRRRHIAQVSRRKSAVSLTACGLPHSARGGDPSGVLDQCTRIDRERRRVIAQFTWRAPARYRHRPERPGSGSAEGREGASASCPRVCHESGMDGRRRAVSHIRRARRARGFRRGHQTGAHSVRGSGQDQEHNQDNQDEDVRTVQGTPLTTVTA